MHLLEHIPWSQDDRAAFWVEEACNLKERRQQGCRVIKTTGGAVLDLGKGLVGEEETKIRNDTITIMHRIKDRTHMKSHTHKKKKKKKNSKSRHQPSPEQAKNSSAAQ